MTDPAKVMTVEEKAVFDLERWSENREFRYFTAEERAVVPLEDEP